MKTILGFAIAIAFGMAGCLETTAADGALKCAAGKSEQCPDGYFCAANNTCFHNGHTAPVGGTCSDGIKNGNETGTDCGGSCAGCAVGGACNVPSDCVTALCKNSVCTAPPQQCLNGVQDPGETDTDCGGPECPACTPGEKCTMGSDCTTQMCDSGSHLCFDQCADGVRDGDESDVDCGGSCKEKCHANQACGLPADCGSGICTNGYCIPVPLPAWVKVLDYSSTAGGLTATCGALGPDGQIYQYGGWDIAGTGNSFYPYLSSYDPVSNSFESPMVSPQSPLAVGVAGCSMVSGTDGKLYVIGGMNIDWTASGSTPTAPVQVYDVATATWDIASYPPVPQTSTYVFTEGAAALVGTSIYTFGGYIRGDGNFGSNITEGLNLTTKSWLTPAPAASSNAVRWQGSAVGTNGLVYVFGGVKSIAPEDVLVSYDPTVDKWSPAQTGLKAMPTARYQVAGATGADGLIYAIGGATTSLQSAQEALLSPVAPGATGTVEAYSSQADTWITVPSLNVAGAYVVTAKANDGRIYALGGANGVTDTPTTNYRKVVEAYGPVVALVSSAGPAGTKRQLTGSNFATNATVNVYFGTISTPVASATSDATGAVAAPIVFTVPSVAAGPYQLKIVDTRSDYPYYATFTVQ